MTIFKGPGVQPAAVVRLMEDKQQILSKQHVIEAIEVGRQVLRAYNTCNKR